MKSFVVTIDGPAASGKSTVAKELGLRLGWFVLESGSLYRAVALLVERKGLDAGSPEHLETASRMAAELVRLSRTPEGRTELLVDGAPVGDALRSAAIGVSASKLAAVPQVRANLLPLQRAMAQQEKFLIAEGRDMGTFVFPEAGIKFFLTASVQVRAKRRVRELISLGMEADLDTVVEEIRARDERDVRRASSPLKPAPDAITVDTSELGVREVVADLFEVVSNGVKELHETDLIESRFVG